MWSELFTHCQGEKGSVYLAVPKIALIDQSFGTIIRVTASLLSVKGKGISLTLKFKTAKLKPIFRLEVANFFLRGQITSILAIRVLLPLLTWLLSLGSSTDYMHTDGHCVPTSSVYKTGISL